MIVRRIVDKLYRLALRFTNPFLVPMENHMLALAGRNSSRTFESRFAAAIERGVDYFANQEALEIAPLFVFKRILAGRGERELSFVEQKLEKYRQEWQDPNLRLLDKSYDPEAEQSRRSRQWVTHNAIEQLIVKCLYADRLGLTEEFIDELAAIDDNGGYGTTHIILGAAILKEFTNFSPDRLARLIASARIRLIQAEARDRAGDLFFERALFLQWQGFPDDVEPAWIQRIIRSQRRDGGWVRRKSLFPMASNQHSSCLALSALIRYREQRKSQ